MTPSETRQQVFDALWKSLISRGVVVTDGETHRALMSTDVWPMVEAAIEAAQVEELVAERDSLREVFDDVIDGSGMTYLRPLEKGGK